MSEKVKVYPRLGERVRTVGNYSEVMMYMGLAGRPIYVARISEYSAQVFRHGHECGSSVTLGEAGFFHDENGYYTYADFGDGDNNPRAVEFDITQRLKMALGGTDVMVINDLGLGR